MTSHAVVLSFTRGTTTCEPVDVASIRFVVRGASHEISSERAAGRDGGSAGAM